MNSGQPGDAHRASAERADPVRRRRFPRPAIPVHVAPPLKDILVSVRNDRRRLDLDQPFRARERGDDDTG